MAAKASLTSMDLELALRQPGGRCGDDHTERADSDDTVGDDFSPGSTDE